MRVLFLGDIVGRAGREAVRAELSDLRARLELDFVVANGENAAGGFGITQKICHELFDDGIDVISTGNHVWDQSDIVNFIDHEPRLLRPVNYPPGTPGRGAGLYDAGGRRVMVINAMGRVFMEPLDDPFHAVDQAIASAELGRDVDFVLVDMHGEATSEKMAMGHYLDGRASLVVGTHSHVPTADARILQAGTAYMTDSGMCGDYDSVIGMDKEEPIRRFTTRRRQDRFQPALGKVTLCGVVVVSDDRTGRARQVAPLRIGGHLAEAWPNLPGRCG